MSKHANGPTWGSANAEDLFKIAVRFGGFDAREVMLEIHRRQDGRNATVNARTVGAALQVVRDRHLQGEGEVSKRGRPSHGMPEGATREDAEDEVRRLVREAARTTENVEEGR